SSDADIWRRADNRLLLVAHYGPIPVGPVSEFGLPLVHGTVGGRSMLEGRPVQVADVQAAADEFPESAENAQRTGFRTILSAPLMRESVAIGAIILRRTEARLFTERQVALLETFADQAVIAIENVRLFNETKEALDQQTATAEILQVISQSPTDTQPVFDAIVKSGRHLCEARFSSLMLVDGDHLALAATVGLEAEAEAQLRRSYPRPLARDTATGRAVLERQVVHLPDVEADREYDDRLRAIASIGAIVAVPILRDGVPVGAIVAWRDHPFTDKQI